MSDNKERGRSDDLFDLLQDFRDQAAPDNASNANGESLGGNSALPASSGNALNGLDNIEKSNISDNIDNTDNFDNSDNSDNSVSRDNIDDIDALLSILNGDVTDNSEGDTQESGFDGDIPVSIFSHLSDEGEEAQETQPSGEFASHFSDMSDEDIALAAKEEYAPTPEEADEDNEDDEDDEDTQDDEHPLFKVGNIFQKMSAVPKAVIYILLVVIVSAYLSYYIITIGNDVFALVTPAREISVTIEEGMTHEEVGKLLEEKEVIEYGWVFELYMTYRGDGDSLNEYVAGEYKLNTNMNYSQIITRLTLTTTAREIVRVTIPEGFTVDQIIDLLTEKGIGTREGYIEAINNYPYKWEFVEQLTELGYSENRKYRLEGYLYPDTYDFYSTESEVYVINKMLAAFDNKFWKDFNQKSYNGTSYRSVMLDEYGLTFDDVIVLASMIQSEGGTAEDFYYISHVFHNRLSHPNDFPFLESDATIQYVLPERETDSSEINIGLDDPYNTYKYKGLPPGAISNAGLDALNAALFPTKPMDADGDEFTAYYFVSNDAGKTYYATTLSGHNKNVAQVKKDNAAMDEGTYVDPDGDYE